MVRPVIIDTTAFYKKGKEYYCKACGEIARIENPKTKIVPKYISQVKFYFKEGKKFDCKKCGRTFERSGNTLVKIKKKSNN